MRAIARVGRRDGRHGRRLHEPRRMRLGVGGTDRLEGVALIERLADAPVFGGRPVARFIDEFDGVFWSRSDLLGRDRAGHRTCRRRTTSGRSEEHTSELQSLMRISYAVFCLKKKKTQRST